MMDFRPIKQLTKRRSAFLAGRLERGEAERPLSVPERKITDVPTRLNCVLNDINAFVGHDDESDHPASQVTFASSDVRCAFQR